MIFINTDYHVTFSEDDHARDETSSIISGRSSRLLCFGGRSSPRKLCGPQWRQSRSRADDPHQPLHVLHMLKGIRGSRVRKHRLSVGGLREAGLCGGTVLSCLSAKQGSKVSRSRSNCKTSFSLRLFFIFASMISLQNFYA